MRRIPPLGGTDGDPFVDTDPSTGTEGSPVPAEFFNAVKAELIAVILSAGMVPDGESTVQLRDAITTLIATIAGSGTFSGVVSVNGDTGPAVSFNFPVKSVNGQLGDVVINVGVTSVNGQSGAVDLDLSSAVSSVNGQTGDVTVSVPVNSVNGKTGNVTISSSEVGAVPTARQIIAGTGMYGGGPLTANRTLNVTFASQADVRAGVSNEAIDPDKLKEAAFPVNLTPGSSVSWSIASGFNFNLSTVTQNFTMLNPTNQIGGRGGILRIYSSGTRSISWGSHFASARPDGLPTEASGALVLGYYSAYNGRIYIG